MQNQLFSAIESRIASGQRTAVLIAGPTASGKSALALEIARAVGGAIINTDALQVYQTLRVLTARPSVDEMQGVPHRLYGFVDCATAFSTGRWLEAARAVLADLPEGQVPIFVGGTGLYFDALINGFADVPRVSEAVRLAVRQEIAGLDATGRRDLLLREDPEAASRLSVVDPQRLERALAVKRATGKPLSAYQAVQEPGLLAPDEAMRLVLDPDRAVLHDRIARRFGAMFENGAVGEVEALLARDLDPSLPAMKAIGVREIAAWLDGRLTAEAAIEQAVVATRQYAKRQGTWFRNRFSDWQRIAV